MNDDRKYALAILAALAYPEILAEQLVYIPKFTFKNRILKKAIREVNYAHPKGCELAMLTMLPWQAYSAIGWLTCTLPSRFSEYRRAAS